MSVVKEPATWSTTSSAVVSQTPLVPATAARARSRERIRNGCPTRYGCSGRTSSRPDSPPSATSRAHAPVTIRSQRSTGIDRSRRTTSSSRSTAAGSETRRPRRCSDRVGLLVVRPVADVAHACIREQPERARRLAVAGREPAGRPRSRHSRDSRQAALDPGALLVRGRELRDHPAGALAPAGEREAACGALLGPPPAVSRRAARRPRRCPGCRAGRGRRARGRRPRGCRTRAARGPSDRTRAGTRRRVRRAAPPPRAAATRPPPGTAARRRRAAPPPGHRSGSRAGSDDRS